MEMVWPKRRRIPFPRTLWGNLALFRDIEKCVIDLKHRSGIDISRGYGRAYGKMTTTRFASEYNMNHAKRGIALIFNHEHFLGKDAKFPHHCNIVLFYLYSSQFQAWKAGKKICQFSLIIFLRSFVVSSFSSSNPFFNHSRPQTRNERRLWELEQHFAKPPLRCFHLQRLQVEWNDSRDRWG